MDLTPEQRKSLPKMGDKSQAFVNKALEVATQNPDFLPGSFDLEEMKRDVELGSDMEVGQMTKTMCCSSMPMIRAPLQISPPSAMRQWQKKAEQGTPRLNCMGLRCDRK